MSDPAPDGTLDLPVTDQVATSVLAPGSLVGRFVIGARLGEGGMGIVLAGEDPDLGRPVAIKLVRAEVDQPAYRARLLREAQAMARIEHPNVVRVYEVGADRGRLFVAMELVDGVTLSTWLRVQRRSWREVVAIFGQIGAGLAFVHRAGFVHRDFKPDNVLVDRDGRARVADFGLARLDPDRVSASVSPELAASLTRTGMAMGTPGYMAPEQQLGGDVDARADQYSYCVALREALRGGHQPAPEDAETSIPRAVRAIVARGLSYEASARFGSMDELVAALGRATTRRTSVLVGVIAAAVLVGGGALAIAVARSEAPAGSILASLRTEPDQVRSDPSSIPGDAAQVVLALDAPARVALALDGAVEPTVIAAPAVAAPVVARAAGSGVGLVPKSPPREVTAVTRHELMPAHLPAVRDAVRELGYGGLTFTGSDLDADLRDLRAKLAAETRDYERGLLLYGIGAGERKRGDCSAAFVAWADARKSLLKATDISLATTETAQLRTAAFRHYGRTMIGIGMCQLAGGSALAAETSISKGLSSLFGVSEAEKAEAQLGWAIAMWETGQEEDGRDLAVIAGRHGDARLRAAIDGYLQATGRSLR